MYENIGLSGRNPNFLAGEYLRSDPQQGISSLISDENIRQTNYLLLATVSNIW